VSSGLVVRRLRLLGLAALLGGLTAGPWSLLWAAPASAASNGQWSLEPIRAPGSIVGRSNFDFSLVPGQTVVDECTLTNYTNQALTFQIYAADAYDTPHGGSFALKLPNQRNVDLGSWVHLPFSTYTLPPNTAVNFPFSITPPHNAAPGDHAGGIVAVNITPLNQVQGNLKLAIHEGVGVRIYGHVVGPSHPGLGVSDIEPNVTLGPFSWATGSGTSLTRFTVQNTGNTIFQTVYVDAKATDIFGRTVHQFPRAILSAFLPATKLAVFEPPWKALPIAGPITLHVTLTSAGIRQTTDSTFWIIPWILVLIIVVILALVGLWWWRRRRRRAQAQAALPEQPEPDKPAATVG